MALVTCPDCGKQISDAAPNCPNCGRPMATRSHVQSGKAAEKKPTSPAAWGCLVIIVLLVFFGFYTAAMSPPSPAGSEASMPAPTETMQPQLEVESWNWHEESGYAIGEGTVKNISSSPLKNVTAVVSFDDRHGGHVTSDDALIDYNPILPGQTSPFKVMATWNPAMARAGVEFKELMGGTIPTRERAKKK